MTIVEITKQPIELYKILKFENMVSSGGEAKMVIANGLVLVNGQVETKKRKQIVSGDTIEFSGDKICIQFNPDLVIEKASTTVIKSGSAKKSVAKKLTKPTLNLIASSATAKSKNKSKAKR